MSPESTEERQARKRKFIELLKRKKFIELFEPIGKKVEGYIEGKTDEENVLKSVRYAAKHGEDLVTLFKKRVDVILAGISMEENRFVTEINEINVKLRHGEIVSAFTDAVICTAGPDGTLQGSAGKTLIEAGGTDIEDEAKAAAARLTEGPVNIVAGKLPLRCIILMPSEKEGEHTRESATSSILSALGSADELECSSIAMPVLCGPSCGDTLEPSDAADAVIEALKLFNPKNVHDVIVIDPDEKTVEAVEKSLERFDEENA